jgi:TonB family protein
MPAQNSDKRSWLKRLKEWAAGGPTPRASLFNYVRDDTDSSVLPDLRDILRHPIRTFREERQAPRTRASLFEYFRKPEESGPFNWKEFLEDLLTEYKTAFFIPSIWSNQAELAEERAELRMRRMESGIASLMVHVLIVGTMVFMAYMAGLQATAKKDPVVFVTPPQMFLPATGDNGGGGGGGGRLDKLPPTFGRMPDTSRVQYMPPDPGQPKPLVPLDSLDTKPTVQMPIDLTMESNLPIGDMTAPQGDRYSYGPGTGGGIGTGSGTGIGPGRGPGYGPGEGGGYGGGSGGGIGNGVGPYVMGSGVTEPEAIQQPKPPYTEEARKNRTEGVLLLQAIIRSNGRVDSFKVIKGLGYGLDESAINTIATKWLFKPGLYHGVPVDVVANIEVTFRLY